MKDTDIFRLRMLKAGIPDNVTKTYIFMCKGGFFPELDLDEIPPEENFRTLGEAFRLFEKTTVTMQMAQIKHYLTIPYSRVLRVREKIGETFDLDDKAVKALYDHCEMYSLTEEEVTDTYTVLSSMIGKQEYLQGMAKRALILGINQLRGRIQAVIDAVEPHIAEEVVYTAATKGFLLYPLYNDPIRGIEYLKESFDRATIGEILMKEHLYLYCFKDEFYIYNNGEEERLEAEINKMLEKYPRK